MPHRDDGNGMGGRAEARWIWTGGADTHPANRFTWFRQVVDLASPPESAELRFAADSTARLWINGVVVSRKVTRFHEPEVRANLVPVARHLRRGRNVVVALHHNWGGITTFQRSDNRHAGLYLEGSWVGTDESWRWKRAEEFLADGDQFRGVGDGTPRIRYPIHWDANLGDDTDRYHLPAFDDSAWANAVAVIDGPWPDRPQNAETPPQRESPQLALAVVSGGRVDRTPREGELDSPLSMSPLSMSIMRPEPAAIRDAAGLVSRHPVTILGQPGETHYVTVDMQRPVHGYPFIDIHNDATVQIEIGYGELAVSPYSGEHFVTADGWIDVDGVVAHGYSDSLRPAPGRRRYELPDERTARWLLLHVTFVSSGSVTIHTLGIVKSQYPVAFTGSFQCGDERVDQIVKLAMVHAEITMSDSYIDTPGREDAQWIEDSRPRALLAARWFGDTRLRRLMIRTLGEGQRSDGNLHPFFPSNFAYGPAQWDWSLQWIGMLADDYRWSADADFVRSWFGAVEDMWDGIIPDVGADGIWRSPLVFGDIRNGRQLGEGDSSGIVTPWVIRRLRDSAELAIVAGHPDTASTWSKLADTMTKAFRETHLTSRNDFGIPLVADSIDSLGNPSGFSQAGQITPIYGGLLTPEEAADAIKVAFPAPDASPPDEIARWNNPTWSYRALRALSVHGHHERALEHLLERYSPYLPGNPRNEVEPALQGSYGGPLPEYWMSRADMGTAEGQLNDRQPIDPTGSHGWGAMPLLWLHEYLLGVTITSVGGTELLIRPVSAGLPFVSGTTVTPLGPVRIHLEPSEPRLQLEIPAGVSAQLHLPRDFAGTQVIETNSRIAVEDPAVPLLLGDGHWGFTARGPRW